MHSYRPVRVAVTMTILLWSLGAAAEAPGLAEAREAYEDARFEDALTILEAPPADLPEGDRAQWLELRAVVLFALRSDGHGDALMDLALLAPEHELSPGLPPELYAAYDMARAFVRDPAEANLARARALYFVADFSGAMEVLGAMHAPTLTREQRVERTVLRALTLFALQRRVACRDLLSHLARIAPTFRFDQRVPPELRDMWDDVRGGTPRYAS